MKSASLRRRSNRCFALQDSPGSTSVTAPPLSVRVVINATGPESWSTSM
jgi:hypothetical protein